MESTSQGLACGSAAERLLSMGKVQVPVLTREGDRQTDRQKRRGRERGEGKRVFFNSLWQGRLVQFHETPISHSRWPPKLRAQESTQKELWETRDSDSREHAYKHCFCFFSSFFKITFPILEDVLLKKSQFKIVLKTYLKIGL